MMATSKMERDGKYATDKKKKEKTVLSSDQKEEGCLVRTKDSYEKINIFLISMSLPALLPFRSISVK